MIEYQVRAKARACQDDLVHSLKAGVNEDWIFYVTAWEKIAAEAGLLSGFTKINPSF